MKKVNFLYVLLFLISGILISCDKEDDNGQDTPGNIPGMGNTEGELEIIEPFEMPEDISIEGEITGFDGSPLALENSGDLTKTGYYRCGSGGRDIVLNITLRNNSNNSKYFVFKRGFVFKCLKEGYQNGICARRVGINIPARSSRKCKLLLYCINAGKKGSSANVRYLAKGITASKRMMELLNALEYKKINVSDFSPEELVEYDDRCTRIQKIIWSVTNGKGVSKDDWKFIKSLPEVI